MKIYLVNLDRSNDRLKYMMKQLSNVSDAVVRVAAVDGTLLSDDECKKASQKVHGVLLSQGPR